MMLPRIEFKRNWALEFWGDTGVLQIKLCRSWDGRFAVDPDKRVLPRFGYRREDRVQLLDPKSDGHTLREVRGWRLWMPYLMLWRMSNHHDNTVVYVDPNDPRAGTTDTTASTSKRCWLLTNRS